VFWDVEKDHLNIPIAQDRHFKLIAYEVSTRNSGFGGLGVIALASVTQVRGFKLGRSRRTFQGEKILSAEGKSSRRSHVTDLRHVKDPYNDVEVAL
jgi:hypothetical protein